MFMYGALPDEALSFALPLPPFYKHVITTVLLIHLDYPIRTFLKNMRKILLDLGIRADNL